MLINLIISLLLSATFEFDIQNFMPNLPYLISGSEVILLPASSSWADSLLWGVTEGPVGPIAAAICFSGLLALGIPDLYRYYKVREDRYYQHLEIQEDILDYLRSFDTAKPCVHPDILEANGSLSLEAVPDPSEAISFGYLYGSPNPPPTNDEWFIFLAILLALFWLIYEVIAYYYRRKKRPKS